MKTWKTSHDPDYAAKKARVEHLCAIADGEVIPEADEPEVVICLDEFGPLNLMPHPGRQWAERGGGHKDPDREARRRRQFRPTPPVVVHVCRWLTCRGCGSSRCPQIGHRGGVAGGGEATDSSAGEVRQLAGRPQPAHLGGLLNRGRAHQHAASEARTS
ncbi:hypothetical protein OG611_39220 [Streptomyces sp. NBC_01363]|nr:hypothetical protein [Streptomyces sp. NBC_01363]